MAGRFEGRVAFITGGSRGIGKGTVQLFAEEGATVAFIDLNEEALGETAKELQEKGYDCYAKVADVTDPKQVNDAFKEVHETFGSIDILVNNAGVIRDNLLYKMTDSDWQTVMDVHLKGSFYASQAAQKYMVEKSLGGSLIFLQLPPLVIGDRQIMQLRRQGCRDSLKRSQLNSENMGLRPIRLLPVLSNQR